MKKKKSRRKVLFICTHNSARSQMAEALLRNLHGDRYEVNSAGTKPSEVNPYAIKTMAEMNIDISTQRAKSVEESKGIQFDYVVTACDQAKENCPFFPGAKEYLHESFEDPSQFAGTEKAKLEKFRHVRDKIKT